jgi:hypothetical protein
MCTLLRLMDIRHFSFRTLCLFSGSNVGVGQTEHTLFRNGILHFSMTLYVSSVLLLGRVAV